MPSPLLDFGNTCSNQITSTDHRFHLQHGPIDLIVDLRGSDDAVNNAAGCARERFATVLQELISELVILRQPVHALTDADIAPQGLVAKTNVASDEII